MTSIEERLRAAAGVSDGSNLLGIEFAEALDSHDPLKDCRDKFCYPPSDPSKPDGDRAVYLCGNSLGLMPKATRTFVNEELDAWSTYGVRGHFESKRSWANIDDLTQPAIAPIVGAKEKEVACMNGLSVNLHLMMVPFYRPTDTRYKIVMEQKAFPSDRYAMASQAAFHGRNPADVVVEVGPREGESNVRLEDIVDTIKREGDKVALVMFSGVHYYTGQRFDIQQITSAAHSVGAMAGFDLAHAVGNVPLQLHDWGADFACWCTYKYLNSGPGGLAGIFVHERHGKSNDLHRFAGWWGHNEGTRFDMTKPFDAEEGAKGFQLSNPPILQAVSLLASLEIFNSVGMEAIRNKSLLITGYLEMLLANRLGEGAFKVLTPTDPEQRGAQLSLFLKGNVDAVFQQLEEAGVVCDLRKPNVVR